MKKINVLVLSLIVSASVSLFASNDRKTTDRKELPQAAQKFIDQHFKQTQIAIIEIDRDSYDVKFVGGAEIEFTKAGDWKEIETPSSSIPDLLIPAGIKQYVAEKHSGTKVTKLSRKAYGYEIELDNRTEIEFSRDGKFIRYDE